jgi:hypothetical protein
MADIFPSTATTNDTLTLGHTIYKYDGEKWIEKSNKRLFRGFRLKVNSI